MGINYDSRTLVQINDIDFWLPKDYHKELTETQIENIRKYDAVRQANGFKVGGRRNRIYFLFLLARYTKKEFEVFTVDDVNAFMNRTKLTPISRNGYIENIKSFFEWFGKAELTNHLKQTEAEMPVQPHELWTESEFKRLIEVAMDERDKCAMAMLWDLGIERKCFQALNVGDVMINSGGIYVTVEGKKRGNVVHRTLKCISSARKVKDWINKHPYKNDPNAPFFISFARNGFGKRVRYNWVYDLGKMLTKRAGINKQFRTHLIRHSVLTDLYRKGYRGIPFHRYAGWKKGDMEQRYVHLTNEEYNGMREAALEGREFEKPIEFRKSKLIEVSCPRCKTMNEATNNYCDKCWFPLTRKVADRETYLLEMLRSQVYKEANQDAKETNEHLDIDGMLDQWLYVEEQCNNPKRKKVPPK